MLVLLVWAGAPRRLHFFEGLGVHLPRLEAKSLTAYKQEVVRWNNEEPACHTGKGRGTRRGGRQGSLRRRDTRSSTVEVPSRASTARASYGCKDAATFEIGSGDIALVPDLWFGEMPENNSCACRLIREQMDIGKSTSVSGYARQPSASRCSKKDFAPAYLCKSS